uniref:Iron-binding zinc finger CDGSH type domain-containing protein n=1 Tax=Panagrolaimus sp. ES5 TaxID=591445 RepID=A0AC34GVT1_9BILA
MMFGRLAVYSPKNAIVRYGSFKNVRILNPSSANLPFTPVRATLKPFTITLEAGKIYSFCTCGLSASQPFCDGSHKGFGRTLLRPMRFTVDKTDKYSVCGCKNSKTLPLCDATHKKIDQTPNHAKATRFVVFGISPAYDGVARELGYKVKNGGFQ